MNHIDQLVARYIATWNETDPVARRTEIERIWAEDGSYTDPIAVAEGLEAIDATIAAVQGQFPGFVFALAGPVDAHHDIARFTWELGPAGGESLVVGFDVAVLTEDGRISRVHGFLDKVPAQV
ncbi:SnoaL-like domain-containing protein [Streptosporangium subroseum]|uniref:SnoaL-like domain-containing protein n=1 Tax=Streptosporangium subroseum TaxID=106412 RepID=A0A239LQY3_9ACTN|nr:nuclear transport factor 2 family protein [Streptosporangium subroseum]SNT32203.1 SnoaL-like domain-containing protein [Streptosporangium subroseum]